jgi:cell division septation protein DedD
MLVQLDLEGSYTFHGVGTLTKNIEGGITFTAPESGVLTPSLYGLYSFEVKDLAQVKKEKEIQKAISQTSIIPIQPVQAAVANGEEGQNTVAERQEDSHKEDSNESKADKRNIIIRLNKRWAEVAAATAAAVILFFFLTYPSLKSNDEMSDTCIASTIYVGKPSDLPKENITARSENVSTTKVTSPANEQAGSENTTANKTVATQGTKVNKESIYKNKDFVIVLASCVTAKNAQLFIDNLNGQGFNEARYVTGEKNRVVYSGYSTYTEATNALIGLRKQNSAFEEAWVLHMNK